MELLLHRKYLRANSTEGNLYIDGKWFCNTIEDTVRAEPGRWKKDLKVYGKTAIPYGRYQVLVTWSNRFQRMLTGVFGVPDYEGIRIHNGKSERSTLGCIIVSYKDDDIKHELIDDKAAMNDLCKLVEEAQKTGKIFLNIVDTMPVIEEPVKELIT